MTTNGMHLEALAHEARRDHVVVDLVERDVGEQHDQHLVPALVPGDEDERRHHRDRADERDRLGHPREHAERQRVADAEEREQEVPSPLTIRMMRPWPRT
jgi:hypothetical protein